MNWSRSCRLTPSKAWSWASPELAAGAGRGTETAESLASDPGPCSPPSGFFRNRMARVGFRPRSVQASPSTRVRLQWHRTPCPANLCSSVFICGYSPIPARRSGTFRATFAKPCIHGRAEVAAEQGSGAVGADAEGGGVKAHELADLGVIHPLDVVEDERFTQGDGELADGLERQVAGLLAEDAREDPVATPFLRGCLGEPVRRGGPGMARAVAEVVAAQVQQDPAQPGAERPVLTVVAQRGERSCQRLLGQALGLVGVAGQG